MTIAFVDGAPGTNDGSGTALAASAQNVSSANFLVGLIRFEGATTTVSSVTDTAGNTWQIRPMTTHANNEPSVNMFYCLNPATQASNIVTATLAAARVFRRVYVAQYSRTGTVTFVDQQVASGDPVTTLSTPNLAAITDGGIVIAGVATFNQIDPGAGTNFTERSNLGYAALIDRIVAAGTYNATGTAPSADRIVVDALAFNESGGGGSSVPKKLRRYL